MDVADGVEETFAGASDLRPEVCRHRLANNLSFLIAIDPHAATGRSGHPVDPISRAYLESAPNPNLPLLRLMMEFLTPGGVLLDLGAHVGTFALTAAARGCRVFAVEASARNVALLRESARLNRWSRRLRVIHAAVSDREGELSFCPYGPWGHVSTPKTGMASVSVPAVRLDEMLAQLDCTRVDFIKMDVEGSEVAALEGAAELLRRSDAPPILYESNYIGLSYYDRTPRDLRAVLTRLGYAHHHIVHADRLIAVTPDDLQGEVVGEYLATKAPLAAVPGWKIEQRLPPRQLVRMIVGDCKKETRFRVQLGRALREAPADLLARGQVRTLLRTLRADPAEEVRAAVAWHAEPDSRGLLGRFLGRLRKGA